MSDAGSTIPFWVFFLSVALAPLQGLGNAIVYFYPRLHAKMRQRYGSSSTLSYGMKQSEKGSSSNVLAGEASTPPPVPESGVTSSNNENQ